MFVFLVWAFVAEQQNWPQRQPLAARHCDAKKKGKRKCLACTSDWPSKWSLAPLASKILRLHFFVVCWASWLDLQVYDLDGTDKIKTASIGKETAYICWTTKPSHSSLWEETLQLITARVDAMSCPCPNLSHIDFFHPCTHPSQRYAGCRRLMVFTSNHSSSKSISSSDLDSPFRVAREERGPRPRAPGDGNGEMFVQCDGQRKRPTPFSYLMDQREIIYLLHTSVYLMFKHDV